tara:strand:+ start:3223 stop:3741 length:519 start_codon:yes stop_codon:yes gene_type:complete
MKQFLCITILIFCFTYCNFANQAPMVSWDMMSAMNYETGDMPDSLEALNYQLVEVAGFIVPLDDFDFDYVKEFLLVPDPMSCIHFPPPPPNQMIHVKMKRKIPLDMDYRGVAIQGTLIVTEPEKGLFSYELAGISAEEAEIDYEDPFIEFDEYKLDESDLEGSFLEDSFSEL